jgi:hypothetical protein
MYNQPDRFSVRHRRAEASYHYVYPDSVDVERVAYVFDYELAEPLPPAAYAGLGKAVAEWSTAWQGEAPPVLSYQSSPGYLRIVDGRYRGHEGTYTFHDTLADIYHACSDRPTTAEAVRRVLGLDRPVGAVEDAFRRFQDLGLMFLDGNLALSLALPAVRGR